MGRDERVLMIQRHHSQANCVVFSTGTASAQYDDWAEVQNGVTAGSVILTFFFTLAI